MNSVGVRYIKKIFLPMPWLLLCVLSFFTRGFVSAEEITFYHNDVSGSPIVATDESGKMLWRESYLAYGKKLYGGNIDYPVSDGDALLGCGMKPPIAIDLAIPQPGVTKAEINDFTNEDWSKGVYRKNAGVSVKSSDKVKAKFVVGAVVTFADYVNAKITYVQLGGDNIAIFTDRSSIDPDKLGYPRSIYVVDEYNKVQPPDPCNGVVAVLNDFTNEDWDRGVYKKGPGISIRATSENISQFSQGTYVKLGDGIRYKISQSQVVGSNIALFMEKATNLDANKVGYPNSVTAIIPPKTLINRIGFHGRPFDDYTGLSYNGARYYDPVIGRFLSVDPLAGKITNPLSLNRYQFSNNNPYKYVDPDGHSPIDVAFFVYDVGRLGSAISNGWSSATREALFDVVLSAIGVASPVPMAGQALKAARVAERSVEAATATKTAAEVLRANQIAGRQAEAITRARLADEANVAEQVTFIVQTANGPIRTRADFVVVNEGKISVIETKANDGALTAGQRALQEAVERGERVVPVGAKAGSLPGITPGEAVNIQKFTVDRIRLKE